MRFIRWFLVSLLLVGTTVWAVLAIYFGDSHGSLLQTAGATLFAVFGLLTLVSLSFAQWRTTCLLTYAVLFFLVLGAWWFTVKPSNDRQWQADVAKLPYAIIEGDTVTVHNIRNLDYRSEVDFSPAYYSKKFDVNKLEGLDLFAIYWMGPAIAHTIVSFNFGDQGHLAVSIEARKELGEGYSTIKGFFRQYELIYIVADERDVIRLRTNYRKDPVEDVYLYRLQPPKANLHRLFMEYIKEINGLHEKPAFYNTLLDNCTTTIWFNTRVNPAHLPFSWKILLSGYLPEYLYEAHAFTSDIPFETLQKQAYINPKAHTFGSSTDFSQHIRSNPEPSSRILPNNTVEKVYE